MKYRDYKVTKNTPMQVGASMGDTIRVKTDAGRLASELLHENLEIYDKCSLEPKGGIYAQCVGCRLTLVIHKCWNPIHEVHNACELFEFIEDCCHD